MEGGTARAVSAKVIATTAEKTGSYTSVRIKGDTDLTLYVNGYDGRFPAEITAREAEEYPNYPDLGVVRIMQYAYLFMRRARSKVIYFDFVAENKLQIKDASFSFALEAIYFNLPKEYHYSGDSNPIAGFLPGVVSQYAQMELKTQLGVPTFFKTDLSTDSAVTIPLDSPIVNMADVFASCEQLPEMGVLESTSTLLNLIIMCGVNYTHSTGPIQAQRIVKREERSERSPSPPKRGKSVVR